MNAVHNGNVQGEQLPYKACLFMRPPCMDKGKGTLCTDRFTIHAALCTEIVHFPI